jgi:4-phytase/acid phosphatase
VKDRRFALFVAAALVAAWPAGAADAPQLKYVVIVTRHGVRSPTWETARLNTYSSEPWPEWEVAPGILTPHGRVLMKLMGDWYRQWLTGEHLLRAPDCQDAGRIYIHADKDQRTVETGHALAEAILPGCEIAVHALPADATDPLFSGVGTPDAGRSAQAIRERLGPDPQKLIADHRAALDALQFLLHGTAGKAEPPAKIGVSVSGKSVELEGPFANASTFSENLMLEYIDGKQGAALGWGRLTRQNLDRVLELHSVYSDLMRRTPYPARARGSNLLAHVLWSLEQAQSGKPVSGALGKPGDALLILSGHDTNLNNLSGMMGVSWKLPGYRPNDTPPGGALIYMLWRGADGQSFVKLRYVAQSLDQMRNAAAGPPEGQDVALSGCPAAECPWARAQASIEKAIDPQFTSIH